MNLVSLEEATTLILAGQVVAIPTDTVYGIAARLDQADKIYALKKRPLDKPLPILAASLAQIEPFLASKPPGFNELASQWPGPTTLILPIKPGSLPVTLPTVAFRIPDHPDALALLSRTGPLFATSANLSGEPPATTPSQITLDIPILQTTHPRAMMGSGRPSTILTPTLDGSWESLRN